MLVFKKRPSLVNSIVPPISWVRTRSYVRDFTRGEPTHRSFLNIMNILFTNRSELPRTPVCLRILDFLWWTCRSQQFRRTVLVSIAQGIVFGIISVYVGLAFGCGLSFVFSDYWNHFRRNEKDGEETRDPTMADGKDVKFRIRSRKKCRSKKKS